MFVGAHKRKKRHFCAIFALSSPENSKKWGERCFFALFPICFAYIYNKE